MNPSDGWTPVHFTRDATAGALTSIESEYKRSRADAARKMKEKRAFAERSAKEVGAYYDAGSLDFLELVRAGDRKSVEVVAARDFVVDTVDTYGTDGGIVAIVGGSHVDTGTLAFPDGPGFEGLTTLGSGSCSVKIYDTQAYPYPDLFGENFSTWQKPKVTPLRVA